ncbi:hypothetical protein Bca4012_010292 [Brassica carinata]|uniref:Uncharacterized protein n=1 Tax=Brassica carinata TaxID=52824 RepID=A0A8X7S1M3_BRACI|nr:hypothetical protein Bca52824_035261 [Brassica carinata]
MTETRSKGAAKETDSATANRIEAIEKALALQNERASVMDEKMQTMLEAVNVMTTQLQRNASTSGEVN